MQPTYPNPPPQPPGLPRSGLLAASTNARQFHPTLASSPILRIAGPRV